MVDEAAGGRIPTIWLMDEDLYKINTMEQIRRFCSRIQFVPYSFKELKDLYHVKISAMYVLNMLKYITSMQSIVCLKISFYGRCKLPEEIPIASPERKRGSETDQPGSTKRPRVEDYERGLPSTKKETNDGLREQLAAKDVEKSDVHALAQTEVQHEMEEFKRSVTKKEKAAEETHLQKLSQVQTELDEYKRSSEVSIKRLDKEASRLREAQAAKESAL
ncbi:hypothetical protein R1flu_018715 [Riccia fluitans]|uniref:Uncharacterized protein n=1 Tax=Riccia fluitans TaxID=41844 RepID=A0ABD1ZHP2_9MARC